MHLHWGLRWLALASVASVVALGGVTLAGAVELGNRYTVKRVIVACLDRADFERFIPLAASSDQAAFETLHRQMTTAARCVDLTVGKTVILDRLDWGRACLRVPGQTGCIWTTVKAVD